MITAKDIQEQGFEHSRKGYDVEEVDVFLERVATDVDALTRQNQELRARVADLTRQLEEIPEPTEAAAPVATEEPAFTQAEKDDYDNQIRGFKSQIEDLQAQLAEKGEDATAISAAIISAQKSAENIRNEARAEGEKLYREAESKAREIVRDALADKQQTLTELEHLKDSRDSFREEYRSLLDRFTKQADTEFAALTTKGSPMDSASMADQEKVAVAEVRAAAAKQQAIPMDVEDSKPTVTGGATVSSRIPSSHDDFAAYGDTDDSDLIDLD